MQNISADAKLEPFPHIIFHNFYDDDELELIWEELNFYTRPKKLFDVEASASSELRSSKTNLENLQNQLNKMLDKILYK